MRRATLSLASLAALSLWVSGTALAEAPTVAVKTPGEVLVILAHEKPGPVDASLSAVKALQEPPFNNFRSMKILSRSGLDLEAERAVEVDLPNGRKLRITLRERRRDSRFKVQVSINRPNQKDYLPLLEVIASPGEPFFVAGQTFPGGTLVVGVRVGERHPARK